jgi:penicillin-binding protein 2
VAVTPIQLAYAIGGIASRGTFHRPHLAFKDQLLALGVDPPTEPGQTFPLGETTLEALTKGMWGVVNEGGGTGASARCPGIDISGKTGTAQVVSVGLQKSAKDAEFKNNAWFVGYAPSNQPEIVVAALVMRGEHSTVAAPVARDVIKAYFDKKLGQGAVPQRLPTQAKLLSLARPREERAPGSPFAKR